MQSEISIRSVKRHIAILKNNGIIQRLGSDKAGSWVILKNYYDDLESDR